jgi:spermidine/putrescine ABC transporter ATP-binding subunit
MRADYLVLKNLAKLFGSGSGEVTAVDDISVEVRQGELVTLLGPSGCGKTTTLRMIAGFETPSNGDILIDGESILGTPPNKRPTTMVFQNYALFPHMSVEENIGYGLKIQKTKSGIINERTEDIMRLVGLSGMGKRSPAQLSGGQQQRVSLGRSLIMEPKVLLFDEPLSNLDAKLRVSTRLEIRKLQRRLKITSVYVTHDQEEAMTIADRIVIMNDGKIQQVGPPKEIYSHPANRFVADFIGKANFLNGRFTGKELKGKLEIEIMGQKIMAPKPQYSPEKGDQVLIVVRPESIELGPKTSESLSGTVQETVYLGSEMIYEVKLGNSVLTVDIPDPMEHPGFANGDEVSVHLKEQSLHILPYEEKTK